MILGIDLGTTNSLASVIIDGKVNFIEFEGNRLLPSIVSFSQNKELIVGQKAKNQYFLDPKNCIKSIKRKMGSDQKTSLNGEDYLPEELSAMILRHIKETAQKQFDCEFKEAVITVPAYFSDDQRKATSIAGSIAGFDVKRIINEPTAASLAYNFANKDEIKAVVYDLGGGTFDVSVVMIAKNIVEVLASHGNNHLGGDDFDKELADYILQQIETTYKREFRDNERVCHQVLMMAEKCKIELSDVPFYTLIENLVIGPDEPPLNIELEVSRTRFEEIIRPHIDTTMNLMHVAMNDAKFDVGDIDQILLVGGSSKIPLIANEFENIFDIAPSASIDPDQSICIGAAIQGGIMEEESIDSILVDITPYTYGTRAVNGMNPYDPDYNNNLFVPLIKRNTPLPVSKSEVFYKAHPEQNEIKIDIYQGDSNVATENKLIGFFNVQDLSQKDGSEEIVLSMKLDLNGILTVVATEKKTGFNKRITIDNSFDHEDISDSVAKISEFFEMNSEMAKESEDSANSDNNPDKTDNEKEDQKVYIAETMIEKAEDKLDKADPEDAEEMKKIIQQLKQEIEAKNVEEVERLTDELTDILFYID